MGSLISLAMCILFVVCLALVGVRLVVGAVKFLYRAAPIIVALGIVAIALLYVDNCAGGKDARNTGSAQVEVRGSED